MATISEIMTQKAKGERNAAGDLWGDHNCAIAAGTINVLVAALEVAKITVATGAGPMTAMREIDAALALARGEG